MDPVSSVLLCVQYVRVHKYFHTVKGEFRAYSRQHLLFPLNWTRLYIHCLPCPENKCEFAALADCASYNRHSRFRISKNDSKAVYSTSGTQWANGIILCLHNEILGELCLSFFLRSTTGRFLAISLEHVDPSRLQDLRI